MIKNFKWLVLVSLTFVACNNDDETIVSNSSDGMPLTAGTADFSKYVALGDSFAAGYSDNALFIEGQNGAYPNIIASQFALVGGGAFTTPLMADNIGGLLFGGYPVAGPRMYFNGAPTPVSGVPSTEITNHLTGLFNNMGVPGAKSYHLLAPGYGNPMGVIANPATASPYFSRFASSTTATVVEDALSQNPTFFSLWIGGNDELGYATAGGDASVNPLTPTATFDAVYNSIITQLTAGGRKGVIANLPYVTTLPYFYVIKYNQLTQDNLTVGGINQVSALNAQLYGPLHNALAYLGQGDRINLLASTGNNPMLMKDETLVNLSAQLTQVLIGGGVSQPMAGALGAIFGQARQTKSTDLICLSASSRIGKPTSMNLDGVVSPSSSLNQLGVTFPMPDRYILLPSEVEEIKTFTDAYNTTIETAAEAKGLALFNAKEVMNQLTTSGVNVNGYTLTSTYVTGGAFSLDGVHPSPRGYALIANKFIEAINAKYGSNLKGVSLYNYRIMFPPIL
jgi:lysophospholipase L1-like esterase